jgi:predicted ATP-dependent endonuclease of OLD family
MAISKIQIKNLLMFKEFTCDFSHGVNIITGSNGTGKTTLLRAVAIQPVLSYPYTNDGFHMFHKNSALKKIPIEEGYVEVSPFADDKYNKDKHIFIPVTEMLSHPEIYPMAQKYNMPYNNSEIDVLENAMQPETKELTPNASKVLNIIKNTIGGEVVYENNTFFIVADNTKTPFVLAASGFQKLGLLWKLLRNGLIESESVLFWNEPENSLNPELMSVLVEILLELQRSEVQIFLATHSEVLANYFDVLRKDSDSVKFYSLYKDSGKIKVDSSDRFGLLTPNTLAAEQVKLYKKGIEKGLSNE